MPKLRKGQIPSIDKHAQASSIFTPSRTHYTFGWKRRKTSVSSYQHYAGATRQPERFHCDDDFSTIDRAGLIVLASLTTLTLLICPGKWPNLTLRLLMLSETTILTFPSFSTKWSLLVVCLLPFQTQTLFEVAIGRAVLSWVSRLDRGLARERVGHWIGKYERKGTMRSYTEASTLGRGEQGV